MYIISTGKDFACCSHANFSHANARFPHAVRMREMIVLMRNMTHHHGSQCSDNSTLLGVFEFREQRSASQRVYSVMPTKGNIVPHAPDGLPKEISWPHGLNGRVVPRGGYSRDSLPVEWTGRVLPPPYHSP